MRADHYKISPTAVMCAMARAKYTSMPFAKEIYKEIGEELQQTGKEMSPDWIIFLCLNIPFVRDKMSRLEGRYYSTNKAIRKLGENIPILELASGLSSRGLEMCDSSPCFIESDLENMIQNKRRIIDIIYRKKGSQIFSGHYFISINPVYADELKRAIEILKRCKSNAPLAIVHEGLFGYLTDEEQETMRDNVRDLLKNYNNGGAWITPDFSVRHENMGFIASYLRRRIGKKTDSPPNFFDSEDEVRDFLAKGGLKLEFVPNDDVARNLSCINLLGLNPDRVVKYAKSYKAAFITLK